MVSNIFYVHPNLGKIPISTNIFQMGWNNQLEIHQKSKVRQKLQTFTTLFPLFAVGLRYLPKRPQYSEFKWRYNCPEIYLYFLYEYNKWIKIWSWNCRTVGQYFCKHQTWDHFQSCQGSVIQTPQRSMENSLVRANSVGKQPCFLRLFRGGFEGKSRRTSLWNIHMYPIGSM